MAAWRTGGTSGESSAGDYRVRQTADGAAISIVADAPVDVDVITDQFVTALIKAGLADPRIEVTRVDTIPRTASGKQELFVSARNPPPPR